MNKLILVSALLSLVVSLSAQSSIPYTGKRIGVLDLSVSEVDPPQVLLSCTLVNTGREKVRFPADIAGTALEWDRMILPDILQGHEDALAEAIRAKALDMDPDDFQKNTALRVVAQTPDPTKLSADNGGCGDLRFDTAYLVEYTQTYMRVRYQIRNVGNRPLQIAKNPSKEGSRALINAYFVTGTKITRGAFQAGSSMIQIGRETLDGWVRPGQVLRGDIRFDIEKRTKFNPNIVLELDAAPLTTECRLTNNTTAVVVEY
jgi:hypothetical protein